MPAQLRLLTVSRLSGTSSRSRADARSRRHTRARSHRGSRRGIRTQATPTRYTRRRRVLARNGGSRRSRGRRHLQRLPAVRGIRAAKSRRWTCQRRSPRRRTNVIEVVADDAPVAQIDERANVVAAEALKEPAGPARDGCGSCTGAGPRGAAAHRAAPPLRPPCHRRQWRWQAARPGRHGRSSAEEHRQQRDAHPGSCSIFAGPVGNEAVRRGGLPGASEAGTVVEGRRGQAKVVEPLPQLLAASGCRS